MKYYYGGVVTGRLLTPSGQGRLSITNSIPDAALLALSEKGHVCEVRPVGKVRPDSAGEQGISFICKRAKVERILSWSEVKAHLRIRIADEQQAQNQEVAVRPEEEVP